MSLALKEKNQIDIGYEPLPTQARFHASPAKYRLFGGAAGGGKVLSNDGVILTPFGWKKGSELKVGDLVNNPDGSTQRIIQIKPEVYLPLWRINFADGTHTDVARDHLWLAWKGRKSRKIKNKRTFGEGTGEIVETQELAEWIERGYKPQIPVCQPQRFNRTTREKNRIDPYLLGVLLGDGCITSQRVAVSCGIIDQAHYKNVLGNKDITYMDRGFYFIGQRRKMLWDKLQLYKLAGKGSKNKFIPEDYKLSSIKNRYQLVRGLLDTDGYNPNTKQGIYYYSISRQLAEDTAFVLRSLGSVVTITKKQGNYKKDGEIIKCAECYCLYIKHPQPDLLVSLERKKSHRSKQAISKAVISVEITKQMIRGRCITVSHPNGLYITNDFIVTHNSHCIRMEALAIALELPGANILVLRRTYPELMGSIIVPFRAEVPNKTADGKIFYIWNGMEKTITFPHNGSVIHFGSAQYETDIYKYDGIEFDAILIDELTHFTYFQFRYLVFSRLRTTKQNWVPCFCGATNPGKVGHAWVKRLWIDQEYDPIDEASLDKSQFDFIPSKVTDNPYINDDYKVQLENLPEKERKALLYGDWDIFEGQFFSEWNYEKHTKAYEALPFEYVHFRVMDWGYAQPYACEWLAAYHNQELKKWFVWVYDELYGTRKEVREIANDIKTKELEHKDAHGRKYEISFTVGDPSMFAKKESASSVADLFKENGIEIRPADNERVPGWLLMRTYLSENRLIVFREKANNLIRTLPQLIHSNLRPEDVDTTGEDHAPDAVRYGLMELARRGSKATVAAIHRQGQSLMKRVYH